MTLDYLVYYGVKKTPQSQNTGELPGNYQGMPQVPIFEIKKTPLSGEIPT